MRGFQHSTKPLPLCLLANKSSTVCVATITSKVLLLSSLPIRNALHFWCPKTRQPINTALIRPMSPGGPLHLDAIIPGGVGGWIPRSQGIRPCEALNVDRRLGKFPTAQFGGLVEKTPMKHRCVSLKMISELCRFKVSR